MTTLNNNYQVTAVQFTEDPTQIVTAGIDNDIKIWDTRKNAMVTEIQVCHGAILSSDSATEGFYVFAYGSFDSLKSNQEKKCRLAKTYFSLSI